MATEERIDPIGHTIMELVDLDDINDHISMRVILGNLVSAAGNINKTETNQKLLDRAAAIMENCRDCGCKECTSIRNDLITCLAEALTS